MNTSCGFDPIHLWHVNVHNYNRGIEPCGQNHGFFSIGCLANDFDISIILEKVSQALTQHRMVIDKQDANSL